MSRFSADVGRAVATAWQAQRAAADLQHQIHALETVLTQRTVERDEALQQVAEARQTIYQLRNKLAACCGSGGAGPHTTGPTETFIPEAL